MTSPTEAFHESNNEQVMIFIDGHRFDRMIHNLNVPVDYKKLINFLTANRKLIGVSYFRLKDEINELLREQLVQLKVKIFDSSKTSTELDRLISNEIRQHRRMLDHIVLVSGNSMFSKIIDESVMAHNCTASIFCIDELLYPAYKRMAIEIIDPKTNLKHFTVTPDKPDIIASHTETPTNRPTVPERERVVILVDAANLMISLQEKRVIIDMYALKRILKGNRKLVAAYYYHSEPVPNYLKRFLTYLRKIGYTLISGGGSNVDPVMINHIPLIAAEGNVDTIIMVSGDGDFLETLETAVDENGIKVEIASFEKNLFEPYKRIPLFEVILLDKILSQIVNIPDTMKKYRENNGLSDTSSLTADMEQYLPEMEVMVPESISPKQKRRTTTQAEKLVGSLKHLITDGSVEEIHLVLKIKGRVRKVDIV